MYLNLEHKDGKMKKKKNGNIADIDVNKYSLSISTDRANMLTSEG